jgi:hypothetical protein
MTTLGLLALLLKVRPPDTTPAAAGAKVTVTVTDCPGVRTVPMGRPLTLKPAPEMDTFEKVRLDPPELETEKVFERLALTFTFPKLRLAGLGKTIPLAGGGVLGLLVLVPVDVGV